MVASGSSNYNLFYRGSLSILKILLHTVWIFLRNGKFYKKKGVWIDHFEHYYKSNGMMTAAGKKMKKKTLLCWMIYRTTVIQNNQPVTIEVIILVTIHVYWHFFNIFIQWEWKKKRMVQVWCELCWYQWKWLCEEESLARHQDSNEQSFWDGTWQWSRYCSSKVSSMCYITISKLNCHRPKFLETTERKLKQNQFQFRLFLQKMKRIILFWGVRKKGQG